MHNAFLILYILAAWFGVSSIFRILRAEKKKSDTPPPQLRRRIITPQLLMVVAAALILASIYWGAPLFMTGRNLTASLVLGFSVLFATCVDTFIIIRFSSSSKSEKNSWITAAFSLSTGLLTLAFVLYLRLPPANGIQLAFPVKGEWKVVTGGRTSLTNYHHGNPDSQNYAVDIIVRKGDSAGEPIYAPLIGIVVRAIDDRVQGSPESRGNVVVIQADDNIQVWLAHLQQNSVLVKEGELVTEGHLIARCGSTGSAEIAHLHIHAEKDGRPVAMRFGKQQRFLLRNAIIHN